MTTLSAIAERIGRTPGALRALPVSVVLLALAAGAALAQYPTTRDDFELPGTQPLAITDNFSTPTECVGCHADYGSPAVEPFRNWAGSMMAQSGRDPLMYAAMAIANQDVAHSGETCLRCHLPKGWLEGRSVPEDGSGMTADDRQGVQCTVCHRMVDPIADVENPAEDAAILGALAAVPTTFSSAQFVMDPEERLRGPFNVEADLGSDPHEPLRETLVSPFHSSSEMCGTCHNVVNPIFTRNMSGGYDPNPLDTPADPALGFPEQSTYDEWAASEFATIGVSMPRFGGNKEVVSTCQDCHMPDVSGRDAEFGAVRNDLPLHEFRGANIFVPDILPFHPVFGAEVDEEILQEGKATSIDFLRKAAVVTTDLAGGDLTVRVQNDSGHKLPTGYPDGRRMWLHVRAFDSDRNVVLESGRYVFSTGELVDDPHLRVWETVHGLDPAWALTLGMPAGPSFHLVLNNVREFDNRIPPRGFTNAAYEAFDGAPVGTGVAYADGQYWDDVVYPVGTSAVQAEVTLYYQTTSKEYVEFLRDENVTNAAGPILFDLWSDHGMAPPLAMAQAFHESDASVVNRCHKQVSKASQKYLKTYLKEWARCYSTDAAAGVCDTASRDAKIAAAETKLRERVGGLKDRVCAGVNLTPTTIGHGPVCSAPCLDQVLFDMGDVADCAVCTVDNLGDEALDAAYGTRPPALPGTSPPGDPGACERRLAKASTKLAAAWNKELSRCANANVTGKNAPALDCQSDPDGRIQRLINKADKQVAKCASFAGLGGCGATGTIPDAQACIEAAVGPAAISSVEVAYP